jgi:hemolysin activation/secretion protein
MHASAFAVSTDFAPQAAEVVAFEDAIDALNAGSAKTFTDGPLAQLSEQSRIPLPLGLEWALSLQPADLLRLDNGLQAPSPLPGLGTLPMTGNGYAGDRAGLDDTVERPAAQFGVSRREWLGSRFDLGGSSVDDGPDRRGRINLSAGNLASSSDYLSFNYKRALETRANSRSQGFGLGYSFPWRTNQFRIYADRSEYEDSVVGTDRKYDVSGDNLRFDFTGNRRLFSGMNTTFDGEFGLSVNESHYSVDEEDGYTSQRQLSVVNLTGKLAHYFGGNAKAIARLSAERGVKILGASADDWANTTGDPRFRKYSFYGSVTKPAWSWTWGMAGRYQYSPDELPYSERMTVVSSSLNSGFAGEYLSGIQGGWLRIDADSPRVPVSLITSLYSSVRVSLLKGWLPETERQSHNYGSASAAELTLRLEGEDIDAGLRIGHMLESSSDESRPSIPDISINASFAL